MPMEHFLIDYSSLARAELRMGEVLWRKLDECNESVERFETSRHAVSTDNRHGVLALAIN